MSPKASIVLIEDDPASRENVHLLLELEGYAVRSAANGLTGLDLVLTGVAPDLVLCDLMLPGLDGFGVLEAVRRKPLLADLPFLILTANTERTSQRQGMNLGADDFITKPFTAEELLTAVATCLRRHRGRAGAAGLDPEEARRLDLLTMRERELLIRIGLGMTSRGIAEDLGISPKTEQAHRARLMLKLGLPNAQALASLAGRSGLR